jgi:hypothetical protein
LVEFYQTFTSLSIGFEQTVKLSGINKPPAFSGWQLIIGLI